MDVGLDSRNPDFETLQWLKHVYVFHANMLHLQTSICIIFYPFFAFHVNDYVQD